MSPLQGEAPLPFESKSCDQRLAYRWPPTTLRHPPSDAARCARCPTSCSKVSPRNRFERRCKAVLWRIQDPDGFAVRKGLSILNAPRVKFAPRLHHPVPEVRREDGMVRSAKRVVLRQRLFVVYVERRGDLSSCDCGNKGRLVDE